MSESKRIAVVGATGRVGAPLVEELERRGHDVVGMSRSSGVDVITGEGLATALAGVEVVVDVSTCPSPEGAAEFFATAAGNLQEFGERAGVAHLVVVSIIGVNRFSGGYNAAKLLQERTAQAGSIPVSVLRAAQFHEFVATLADWSRDGDLIRVPQMRTQLVAARTVAEGLADLAEGPVPTDQPVTEIGGPREERLAEAVRMLTERRGESVTIEEGSDAGDPDVDLYATEVMLPGPGATLAGPTFAEWLAGEPAAA